MSSLVKAVKGFVAGAVIGSAIASLDGLFLGLLFGDVLSWTGYFVLGGGSLGGLTGLAWALWAHKLILPPGDK